MHRNLLCIAGVLLSLLLCSIGAVTHGQIEVPRSVVANGGGAMGGPNHQSIGTLGQVLIGKTGGPAVIHELGFWYGVQMEPSGIVDPVDGLPTEYAFWFCSLPPAHSAMDIHYAITQAGHVTIKLYDVSGREVHTLVDTETEPGLHRTVLCTDQLPAGVYFCRMITGTFVETRRAILLR